MSRFIISGGGTGGHVYPAIAIAEAIRRVNPEAEILFIGAKGKLEMEQVPAAGFSIKGLPVTGIIRRMAWENLLFPINLVSSLVMAWSIIRRFDPDVVVGVGGYASGPALRAAISLGKPALIQEQNSYPGITNRLLSSRVQRICVAFDGMDRYFPKEKILCTGNPVRPGLFSLPGHLPEGYAHFHLDPSKKTVFVMGGSGGAKSINDSALTLLGSGLPDNVQLLWQTGNYYFAKITRTLSETNAFRIVPFIDRMDLAYSCADLVVCRAGAITMAELCAAGKPVILVPSPNVAEDHQSKNARSLVEKEAALMIPDNRAVEELPEMVTSLIQHPEKLQHLGNMIKKFAVPDAADRIAREVIKLIPVKTDIHGG